MNFLNSINNIETAQVTNNRTPRAKAREGVALLRLRDYLELGLKQPKNPEYKPAKQVRLTFELLHPDHMITGKKADGTEFAFPDTLNVYLNVGGPTSRFGKLFAKLNYDGSAVHFAQLVGKGFMGQIFHNGDYVNISNADGEWTIGAPEFRDPMTNVITQVDVPEMDGTPKVFIYDHPDMSDADIQEMWDGIFIEGENQDGKSKNWIQNAIMESLDWETSRTKSIVDGTTAGIVDSLGTQAGVVDPLAALGIK